jgi:hypothetical protein
VLSADATRLWRWARPRAGWWRTTPRARLPTRPLSQRQSNRAEARKRHAWLRYRSWGRITSGVWLRVMGAVQSGTSQVGDTRVPHGDAQEWRPYRQHVRATCRNTDPAVVLVVERRGLPRAQKRESPGDPDHGTLRVHFFPAHCGHHLNPMAGFWRVMQEASGAGRGFADLQRLYQRTRQVLMRHQERPIYACHWERIPPRTSRVLLML